MLTRTHELKTGIPLFVKFLVCFVADYVHMKTWFKKIYQEIHPNKLLFIHVVFQV